MLVHQRAPFNASALLRADPTVAAVLDWAHNSQKVAVLAKAFRCLLDASAAATKATRCRWHERTHRYQLERRRLLTSLICWHRGTASLIARRAEISLRRGRRAVDHAFALWLRWCALHLRFEKVAVHRYQLRAAKRALTLWRCPQQELKARRQLVEPRYVYAQHRRVRACLLGWRRRQHEVRGLGEASARAHTALAQRRLTAAVLRWRYQWEEWACLQFAVSAHMRSALRRVCAAMRAAGLADAMRCGAEAMMHMGAAHHRSCALPHSMLSWCRRARWSAQARALDGRGRRIRLISISRRVLVKWRASCRAHEARLSLEGTAVLVCCKRGVYRWAEAAQQRRAINTRLPVPRLRTALRRWRRSSAYLRASRAVAEHVRAVSVLRHFGGKAVRRWRARFGATRDAAALQLTGALYYRRRRMDWANLRIRSWWRARVRVRLGRALETWHGRAQCARLERHLDDVLSQPDNWIERWQQQRALTAALGTWNTRARQSSPLQGAAARNSGARNPDAARNPASTAPSTRTHRLHQWARPPKFDVALSTCALKHSTSRGQARVLQGLLRHATQRQADARLYALAWRQARRLGLWQVWRPLLAAQEAHRIASLGFVASCRFGLARGWRSWRSRRSALRRGPRYTAADDTRIALNRGLYLWCEWHKAENVIGHRRFRRRGAWARLLLWYAEAQVRRATNGAADTLARRKQAPVVMQAFRSVCAATARDLQLQATAARVAAWRSTERRGFERLQSYVALTMTLEATGTAVHELLARIGCRRAIAKMHTHALPLAHAARWRRRRALARLLRLCQDACVWNFERATANEIASIWVSRQMRRRGFEAFQRHQASTLLASRLLTTALQRQRLDAEHEHTRGRRAEASARAPLFLLRRPFARHHYESRVRLALEAASDRFRRLAQARGLRACVAGVRTCAVLRRARERNVALVELRRATRKMRAACEARARLVALSAQASTLFVRRVAPARSLVAWRRMADIRWAAATVTERLRRGRLGSALGMLRTAVSMAAWRVASSATGLSHYRRGRLGSHWVAWHTFLLSESALALQREAAARMHRRRQLWSATVALSEHCHFQMSIPRATRRIERRRYAEALALWRGRNHMVCQFVEVTLLLRAQEAMHMALVRWRRWHESRVCCSLLDTASSSVAAEFTRSVGGGQRWRAWHLWRAWAIEQRLVQTLQLATVRLRAVTLARACRSWLSYSIKRCELELLSDRGAKIGSRYAKTIAMRRWRPLKWFGETTSLLWPNHHASLVVETLYRRPVRNALQRWHSHAVAVLISERSMQMAALGVHRIALERALLILARHAVRTIRSLVVDQLATEICMRRMILEWSVKARRLLVPRVHEFDMTTIALRFWRLRSLFDAFARLVGTSFKYSPLAQTFLQGTAEQGILQGTRRSPLPPSRAAIELPPSLPPAKGFVTEPAEGSAVPLSITSRVVRGIFSQTADGPAVHLSRGVYSHSQERREHARFEVRVEACLTSATGKTEAAGLSPPPASPEAPTTEAPTLRCLTPPTGLSPPPLMAEVEAALQRLNATAATAATHPRSDPTLLSRG